MRTGNALVSIAFQRPGESEVRVTLLDDGADGVAELVDADAPWEESAAVPLEAMSRFRMEAESLPDRWAPVGGHGEVRLDVSLESDGRAAGFQARVTNGAALPDSHRWLVALVATTVGTALVGARSRRALAELRTWLDAMTADG